MSTTANFPRRLPVHPGRRPGQRGRLSRAAEAVRTWTEPRGSSHWLLAVIVIQFVCQIALMGSLGRYRAVVRSVAFLASLMCVALVPKGGLRHPARSWAVFAIGLVGLQILNPNTAGFFGGVAHLAMYFAVISPIFWVGRLKIDMDDFRRIIIVFWTFYALSAAVGMLQVYFPDRFMAESQDIVQNVQREGLKITLASGERILRPMGLSDTAGGAAIAGFYTCVVGSGLLLAKGRWWWRAIVLAGMTIGVFSIYLSHVRSLLVMSLICMFASAAALGMRGKPGKFLLFSGLIVAVFVVAWVFAVDVGGDSVRDRVGTLTSQSASDVYYSNRGHFLEHTLEELLPEYPIGAGLARWGMMGVYFGDFAREAPPIWVEIQWTGWLLDGGVPLLIAYPAALVVSLWTALKIALGRLGAGASDMWIWGGVMVGYNIGALAVTFNAPLFMGTPGLEFWMLNCMLFAAVVRADRAAAETAAAATESVPAAPA
ncbi:hypothetical protein LVJ94_14155 [Pendulispora rubella]|uniref:O-antigen ligase domain-containing protein n=1 Tax=Pendulispora rubella TaxID=2741070 RepID=A0ABZ2LC77_9BACT